MFLFHHEGHEGTRRISKLFPWCTFVAFVVHIFRTWALSRHPLRSERHKAILWIAMLLAVAVLALLALRGFMSPGKPQA